MRATPDCDRACLYRVLDQYLAGLKARDTRKVAWAARVKNTENNVELRVGDGLWGTITALDAYEMRFADPQTGSVAIFGVVQETTERSPYATRLKVVDGTIAEVETIVVRPSDAGIPFVTADIKPLPVWDEILTPALRSPRQKMIDLADGYFDTLQLNDGTLRTEFADDCNRREDGMQSTNNVHAVLDPISKWGCADQFRLGQYRYDDRLRDRRYLAVDEERGIVLAGGFIDHEGRLGDFKLTDGTTKSPIFRRPHSFVLLEAFKIRGGKIQQIEAVFITVPYNMPSPWTN
ncbi:MAG: hypothetical protein IPH71_15125 [Proteobacteria bacterium]|nr:hypothetical protein [Pseudomonadota bacterium]MCC6631120.1 hypothetical protein [Gammaproteobacteria bacterium]